MAHWKARAPRGALPDAGARAIFEEALMYDEVTGSDVHRERAARRHPW
ncbi:MAG: hypothetical protein ACRENE_09015 [Polyangiaceae bacterium]